MSGHAMESENLLLSPDSVTRSGGDLESLTLPSAVLLYSRVWRVGLDWCFVKDVLGHRDDEGASRKIKKGR